MIGRTIGRYRILSKLGEGGMGSVWRAEDPVLHRAIALKVLPDSLAGSEEARQRFLREARAASALHHSGIATVFDVLEADGRFYIAMHLVDGETVSAKVAAQPLDIAAAVEIAVHAGTALAYAHDHGILHRDVTSRNIMVDREGRVFVVDFGLAHPSGRTQLTESGSFLGTVAYVAPEVLQGGKADARADVYSLGVVLYEMLTGRLPFTGDRQEAVMYAAVHQEPAPPSRWRPELPPELDAVVLRALAKRPDSRYPSAADFVQDLEKSTQPRPRRARKLTWVWILGLGSLLLTMLLTTLIVTRVRFAQSTAEEQVYVPRLAVLPLENLSPEVQESVLLLEGLGSSLTTKLGKILGPAVIPWITSRRFTDTTDLLQVATELRVETLIVGTFRKSGDRVRVSIALVDGATGVQKWSEEFEESFADIFALENQIATNSATHLKGQLTGQDLDDLGRPAAHSSDAYLQYLQGSLTLQEGTLEATERAGAYFDAALTLDPSMAVAHVGKGAVLAEHYYRGRAGQGALDAAAQAFRRALELDPSLHAARGGLVRVYSEWGQSEECLKIEAEIRRSGSEDAEAHFARAEALFFGGFADLAVAQLERVLALDPASVGARWLLTVAYAWMGSYEKAIHSGNEFISKFGPDPEVLLWMAWSSHGMGDLEEAELYYQRSQELFGDYSNVFVLALHTRVLRDLGKREAEVTLLDELLELTQRLTGPHPDNSRIRVQQAYAEGALGNRARLEEDENLFLRGALRVHYSLALLVELHFLQGDLVRANELMQLMLQHGVYNQCFESMFQDWAEKNTSFAKPVQEVDELRQRLLVKYGVPAS